MVYENVIARKLLNFLLIVSLVICLFMLKDVNAEQIIKDGNKNEIFELGEIVVTADRTIQESPTTISEVAADNIETRNSTNLGEALSLLPGIYFHQGRSKQGLYASIRGFEQDKTLILLDGMPIYEPYEGLVNLSDIPVQNIAKIKVVKGLASAIYGPNTMGGVINIITKKGSLDPSAALSYQVGGNDSSHLEASHGWTLGNFSYFIAFSHKASDGFNMADGFTLPSYILASMARAPSSIPHTPIASDHGQRDNSDYERNTVTFTGNLAINNKSSLGLSFEYYNNEYGVPPAAIYRETRSAGGTAHWYPRYWRYDDWERYTINMIGESYVSDSLRFKTRVFYDNYTNILNAYDDPTYTTMNRLTGAPSGKSKYDDYNTGLNLDGFWTGINANNIRLGFTLKKDVHREKWQTDPGEKLSSLTYSAALEDEILLSNKIIMTLGASYGGFEKLDRIQASGTETGENIKTFNPQIGITYNPSSSTNLYVSIGKKTRFPTMRNLYADGAIGPQGNPDMREEKTYSFEFGGKQVLNPKLTFEEALFYNDIKGLILFDNEIGRFEQYKNARISGVEFSILSQITNNLSGRLSYTFLNAMNHDSTITIENDFLPDLVYTPKEIPYRPKHKIDADITQSFPFGITINLNGSYVSQQFFYDKADSNNNRHFVAVKKSLDAFFLLNSKISYDFKKHYQVFMAFENLLNQNYQELYLSPAPGFMAWAGVKFTL
jgi:outer membrane receptor protein involved in Fe transport